MKSETWQLRLAGQIVIKVIKKSKLATVVESDLKAPFSIATKLRCRGEHYSILWIASLSPWYVPYNDECCAKRYQVPFFASLILLDLVLNPSLLGHCAAKSAGTVEYSGCISAKVVLWTSVVDMTENTYVMLKLWEMWSTH